VIAQGIVSSAFFLLLICCVRELMAAIERLEAKRRRRRMRAKGCATLLRLAECLQLPGEAFVEAKLPPLSPICHGTRSKAGRKRKVSERCGSEQVCLNPLPQPRRKATVSKRERDDAELAQCAKLGCPECFPNRWEQLVADGARQGAGESLVTSGNSCKNCRSRVCKCAIPPITLPAPPLRRFRIRAKGGWLSKCLGVSEEDERAMARGRGQLDDLEKNTKQTQAASFLDCEIQRIGVLAVDEAQGGVLEAEVPAEAPAEVDEAPAEV